MIMDEEKLQKVYDVMVRDGHISDATKNPFPKWVETWGKPDKQGKLYDFLSSTNSPAGKPYVTKPREQWLGETFGTPQVEGAKKKSRNWISRLIAAFRDGFRRYSN